MPLATLIRQETARFALSSGRSTLCHVPDSSKYRTCLGSSNLLRHAERNHHLVTHLQTSIIEHEFRGRYLRSRGDCVRVGHSPAFGKFRDWCDVFCTILG